MRVLGFLGHDVVRENHIGDWGRPFGMLIEHLVDVGAERAERLGVGDLDAFYKEATTKFADDDEFRDRARQRVVLLQSGDEETLALWRSLVAQSATHWNEVYVKLGVLLTDDDLAGESRYEALMPEVVERLDTAGLLEESDGAEVVFPPGFTNREGEPLPLIVRSRAGAFTYATSDLACVVDRVERVGADPAALRRRGRAVPASGDGVRCGRDGRLAGARRRGPSTSRSASCSGPIGRR